MDTVTADTNLYVSAFNFGGRPLQLIEFARAGVIRLAMSEEIRSEVRRVLRDKFAWPDDDLDALDADLASFTVLVRPTERLAVVQADPDDDRVLECAVASRSSVVVSGDHHLLDLGSYAGMPIMRVAAYLDRAPGGGGDPA